VSCLVRNYEAGMTAFLEEDGMDHLIRLSREDLPKVQRCVRLSPPMAHPDPPLPHASVFRIAPRPTTYEAWPAQ